MDKDSSCANRFIVYFYLFHMLVIISTLEWQDKAYWLTFFSVLFSLFWILFFGLLYQTVKWNNKHIVNVIILIIKGTLICIIITFASLIIVSYGLVQIFGNVTLTKSLFNSMVTSSFLLTFTFYYIYQKPKVQDYIERLAKRIAKKFTPTFFEEMKNGNSNLASAFNEEEAVKEKVHKYIDLITILVTIFLLSNSTFTTLNPSEVSLTVNPFDSLEYNVLIYVIPVYVQSAFYRLTL